MRGAVVEAAFSQERDELSLTLEGPGAGATLRIRCSPGRPLIWRTEGGGRARRNTASVLGDVERRRVLAVRVATRDRHLYIELEGGGVLHILAFGPRPNVFLVDEAGVIRGAFLREGEWMGREAPAPRPARWCNTADELRAAWTAGQSAGDTLARVLPSLGRVHTHEAARRAGVDPDLPADPSGTDLDRIHAAVMELEAEITARPAPHIYSRGRVPEALALIALTAAPAGWQSQPYPTVDEAVRSWAVRSLAVEGFLARCRPLESALSTAEARLHRRAAAMADELDRPSRAERHERDAHLLMAQDAGGGPGRDRILLPNILDPAAGESPESVEIVLDPALSIVDNAQRLYARAREVRAARTYASNSLAQTMAQAARATQLLTSLRVLVETDGSVRALEDWRTQCAAELAEFTRTHVGAAERLPYRRFELPGGWEVRVGRSARDNAELPARHSGPHDMWIHARGVSGSHVVLRRPARTAVPGRDVIEAAAALAAYYSSARKQALVPVIVTERKYVRPIKGAAPGMVRVEREDVVIVKPRGMTGDTGT